MPSHEWWKYEAEACHSDCLWWVSSDKTSWHVDSSPVEVHWLLIHIFIAKVSFILRLQTLNHRWECWNNFTISQLSFSVILIISPYMKLVMWSFNFRSSIHPSEGQTGISDGGSSRTEILSNHPQTQSVPCPWGYLVRDHTGTHASVFTPHHVVWM